MTLMVMFHHQRSFRTPAVRTCTEPWLRVQYIFHRLCTYSGISRSALLTRCTTRNHHHGNSPPAVEHSAANGNYVHPLYAGTAKWRWSWYIFSRLCTHPGKSRSALFTRCTTQNDPHSNSLLGVEKCEVNGIFVHTLYGPIQLHGGGPRTSPACCVHMLGSPVAPCTLGA